MDNMLPSSGEEYLRMVKAQARSCPAVVVAPQAKEHLSVKNTSLKYKTDWYSCRPAPEGCAPTKEWKEHFMKEFTNDRANLKKRCNQIQESKLLSKIDPQGQTRSKSLIEAEQNQSRRIPSVSSVNESTSTLGSTQKAIPKMFDEQGWRSLLYGSTVTQVVSSPSSGETENSELTTTTITKIVQSDTPAASISMPETVIMATATKAESVIHQVKLPKASNGMVPQPQFLARLNQGHLIHLLKYHLRWMAEDDIQEDQGRWLYALFLKLDPLVESDEVAILRNLAKKCARIRSHLHSESGSKLASVNMVITIVAQLFGQSDLE
ncbi:gem (nuclear organelle) associated protein 2 [Entomortierella lignicola]|nr:gem (nuclear organelle) associated protein 2 [Entomortierella lignicola]